MFEDVQQHQIDPNFCWANFLHLTAQVTAAAVVAVAAAAVAAVVAAAALVNVAAAVVVVVAAVVVAAVDVVAVDGRDRKLFQPGDIFYCF